MEITTRKIHNDILRSTTLSPYVTTPTPAPMVRSMGTRVDPIQPHYEDYNELPANFDYYNEHYNMAPAGAYPTPAPVLPIQDYFELSNSVDYDYAGALDTFTPPPTSPTLPIENYFDKEIPIINSQQSQFFEPTVAPEIHLPSAPEPPPLRIGSRNPTPDFPYSNSNSQQSQFFEPTVPPEKHLPGAPEPPPLRIGSRNPTPDFHLFTSNPPTTLAPLNLDQKYNKLLNAGALASIKTPSAPSLRFGRKVPILHRQLNTIAPLKQNQGHSSNPYPNANHQYIYTTTPAPAVSTFSPPTPTSIVHSPTSVSYFYNSFHQKAPVKPAQDFPTYGIKSTYENAPTYQSYRYLEAPQAPPQPATLKPSGILRTYQESPNFKNMNQYIIYTPPPAPPAPPVSPTPPTPPSPPAIGATVRAPRNIISNQAPFRMSKRLRSPFRRSPIAPATGAPVINYTYEAPGLVDSYGKPITAPTTPSSYIHTTSAPALHISHPSRAPSAPAHIIKGQVNQGPPMALLSGYRTPVPLIQSAIQTPAPPLLKTIPFERQRSLLFRPSQSDPYFNLVRRAPAPYPAAKETVRKLFMPMRQPLVKVTNLLDHIFR